MTKTTDLIETIRRLNSSIASLAEHLKHNPNGAIVVGGLGERLTAYTQGLTRAIDQLEKRIQV